MRVTCPRSAPSLRLASLTCLSLAAGLPGCGNTPAATDDGAVPAACASAGITEESRFPAGDPVGATDLFAARAMHQARAGRLDDAAQIVERPDPRQRVRLGDYLILNDRIAAYIEAPGVSDGYFEFGGEILALDRVGDDGKPRGRSTFGETMLLLSGQAIKAEKITVMNDGTNGKAAVLRVSGKLTDIPFLAAGALAALFHNQYDTPAAIDYILEPGAETLRIRLSLMNPFDQPLDLTAQRNVGFFQLARQQMFSPGVGYGAPSGKLDWIGFDGGDNAFVFRAPGSKMMFYAEISGFVYATVPGFALDACGQKSVDWAEYIVGGPDIDGALAALRRADNQQVEPWRTITGRVTSAGMPVIAGAPDTGPGSSTGVRVHARRGGGGEYLSRATADAQGAFTIHVPTGDNVELTASAPGRAIAPAVTLGAAQATADIVFPAAGTITVRATDAESKAPLPVRVQVIPTAAPAATPPAFGIDDELRGRLHQAFSIDGTATLTVPPGEHRVIVSRGFEWELLDRTVQVAAGQTVAVEGSMARTVDSRGVMCADFHIHSHFSADSTDDVAHKVRGAIADGLEIPVSSEHEWIIDFQPIIRQLGLDKWAFGFPSEEFTTFTWGHFGVIPIQPRPEQVNNGAVLWIGRTPPQVFADIARLPEKPVLIINHPSGGGFGAYFSSVRFNRATATGDAGQWSEEFGAIEVFNGSDLDSNRTKSVADWFAMLNAGKTRWAVGNSDSHSLRGSAVGYPRTCFRFGHDDPTKLSAEAVRDELARGNAVVSGGLMMEVRGPGGEGPGQTIMGAGKGPGSIIGFEVVVQAPTWLEAKQLETIVDGESVATDLLRPAQSPTGGHRYEAHVDVKVPASMGGSALHWVVFHASSPGATLAPVLPADHPFAVSNPIFF